mmetsp:Transcript_17213/g.37155  ORF Transcript_17213/g.37155 Transcript_17213/m.37155 type:complete len:93 (+) Transcript_17213:140-418(+)
MMKPSYVPPNYGTRNFFSKMVIVYTYFASSQINLLTKRGGLYGRIRCKTPVQAMWQRCSKPDSTHRTLLQISFEIKNHNGTLVFYCIIHKPQ